VACFGPAAFHAGWVLLNSCGGVLAERAYKTGDLPFFAKFVSDARRIVSVVFLLGFYPKNRRCVSLVINLRDVLRSMDITDIKLNPLPHGQG
jgi:hypothetical protein